MNISFLNKQFFPSQQKLTFLCGRPLTDIFAKNVIFWDGSPYPPFIGESEKIFLFKPRNSGLKNIWNIYVLVRSDVYSRWTGFAYLSQKPLDWLVSFPINFLGNVHLHIWVLRRPHQIINEKMKNFEGCLVVNKFLLANIFLHFISYHYWSMYISISQLFS